MVLRATDKVFSRRDEGGASFAQPVTLPQPGYACRLVLVLVHPERGQPYSAPIIPLSWASRSGRTQ